jgi:hypothetical protein
MFPGYAQSPEVNGLAAYLYVPKASWANRLMGPAGWLLKATFPRGAP